MAGLYIHIPFCRQKCRYCDFYSVASDAGKGPMLKALHAELEMRREEFAGEFFSTLYFGGGTPTIYAPEELQGLIDRARRCYSVENPEEVTVEANPDDLTGEYLFRLRKTDINRLSIGVQSFFDEHLDFFNRRHTGKQAFEAVRRAKEHGFENITLDLIYGVPGMTDAQWEENLRKFIELDVPHLSAYHLGIEPRTVLGKWMEQGRISPVSDETSQRHYGILERLTAEAGYLHYEISNFARPGYEAVHNSNYWRGVPYLGIGPAAHSFRGNTRRWNTANNKAYMEGMSSGSYYEIEKLSDTDRFNETLMTGLRTAQGIAWEELRDGFGEERTALLRESARKYISSALLVDDGRFLRIPSSSFLLSDAVIAGLFVV